MNNNLSLRLKQARKAAGLSMRDLASLVSLSHMAIKKYEDGILFPSSDMLLKLAKALNVRVDFFFRPVKVSLGEVKFRKRKHLSKKSEETLKMGVTDQIERRFELENLYPSSPMSSFTLPQFPPIKTLDDLESLAEKLRDHWKLGTAPICDLIDALESRGVRVFVLDHEYFDGLAATIENLPILVISSDCPGDRQRFSLAHELAHYILKDILPPNIDEEEACNRFAGAFLFPKEALIQVMGKSRSAIELQELLLLKEQFQVSMGSICHRLRDLKIISESHYKTIIADFKLKGWNLKEPGPQIPPNKAHAFKQMLFHALGEEYIGDSKAAELLQCSLDELKELRLVQNGRNTR